MSNTYIVIYLSTKVGNCSWAVWRGEKRCLWVVGAGERGVCGWYGAGGIERCWEWGIDQLFVGGGAGVFVGRGLATTCWPSHNSGRLLSWTGMWWAPSVAGSAPRRTDLPSGSTASPVVQSDVANTWLWRELLQYSCFTNKANIHVTESCFFCLLSACKGIGLQ